VVVAFCGTAGRGLVTCLGGSRGGRTGGLGLGVGGGGVFASVSRSFLLGGGGKCDVERPVVSIRNGTGGGLGFVSSPVDSCCASLCAKGSTRLVASWVVWLVRAYSYQKGHAVTHLTTFNGVDMFWRRTEAGRIL
jgi:hypothetical protein